MDRQEPETPTQILLMEEVDDDEMELYELEFALEGTIWQHSPLLTRRPDE